MRIAVFCYGCNIILDEGEVDEESSLLLFNDFTIYNDHEHHIVGIRKRSSCPQDCKAAVGSK